MWLFAMYVRGKNARAIRISKIRIASNSIRKIAKAYKARSLQAVYDGRVEMDTHADTFVAGRNCLLMHYTERVCDVMPYSDEYQARKGVEIVQVATGYTAANGQRTILIINEALWMPELENSLMNPNQLRHFGVDVQDNPYNSKPMLICKDTKDEEFTACLKSTGTNIYIDTWTPTDKDLQEYPQVVLTSDALWDPHAIQFPGVSNL